MKKFLFLTLASVLFSVASFAIGSITGTFGVCMGSSTALTDTTGGGVWSHSSNTFVATVDSSTGVVTGVSAGFCNISYTVGGTHVSALFTVSAPPGPVLGGPVSICVGSTATLSDTVTGGVWTSSAPGIAAVDSFTGVVTGVSGSALSDISYTVGPGCAAMLTVTINATPTPDSVYGPSGVCAGSTITMTDGTTGGVWSSSNTAIAIVGSGGVVTGISAGFVSISYAVTGVCGIAYAPTAFVVVSAPGAGTISGASMVCAGSTISLSDGKTGGVWSSSNTAIATVGAFTGIVTGVSSGLVDISYSVTNPCGAFYAIQSLSVTPGTSISAITGLSGVCVGSTITLSDATTGGVWSSGSTGIATVGGGGVVTGVSSGTAVISYGVTGLCGTAYATDTILVSPAIPPDSITGPSTVCLGSTIVLSDITPGGVWSSSSTAIAIVSSGGVVTGITLGSAFITYTTTGTCSSAYVTHFVSVTSTVSAGSITGLTTVMAGLNTTLYDGVSGGVWSSSNSAIASVNPATGVVTGVATGTASITYTVTGCGGTAFTTVVFTVTAPNIISGNINFSGTGYIGPVKVWLITYNAHTFDLEAIDSTIIYSAGASGYYQFLGEPSDSFRIKADVNDSLIVGLTGYVPTYHTSSYYWYSATVLNHTGGTDTMQDIDMLTGTITAGPGFIGGSVLTGANKGTLTGIPAVGLKMYCIDEITGAIVQQTYTDTNGNYSFKNLPLATYYVHPEALNYRSIDYTAITLTTDEPGNEGISFIQHTLSFTITPVSTTGVNNIREAVASVITYPNPTTGKLNIQWQEPTAEKATITISDVTGREVYKTIVNMNQGSGNSQVDLETLTDGLYMISIKSSNINYNNKIQVQR